jgi:hypothetical protein
MRDFLFETRPRLEKLTMRIIRQIGLPQHLASLEKEIVARYLSGNDADNDDDED